MRVEHTPTKENKCVVNRKREHLDISFREPFITIKVYL